MLFSAAMSAAAPVYAVVPSTFGIVVGQGLLCLSQLDTGFFYNYLQQYFGKPYKHEGNAYWFKTPAQLWGAPVTDVLVSDSDSPVRFLAAVASVKPDVFITNIADAVQISFKPTNLYPNPVRMSQAGSTIVYFNKKSKIFCAKAKVLMPG